MGTCSLPLKRLRRHWTPQTHRIWTTQNPGMCHYGRPRRGRMGANHLDRMRMRHTYSKLGPAEGPQDNLQCPKLDNRSRRW